MFILKLLKLSVVERGGLAPRRHYGLGNITNHSKFILNIYEVQHNGFPFRMNLGVVDFTTSAALILLN